MLFKITSSALILGVMFLSESAFAGCTVTSRSNPAPALPTTISHVRDSLAPGIKFPSSTAGDDYVAAIDDAGCQIDAIVVTPRGRVVPGVTYQGQNGPAAVFETGIPGIGYALETRNINRPSVSIGAEPTVFPAGPTGSSGWGYFQKVTLVATGSVPTGNYRVPAQTTSTLGAMLNGTVVSNRLSLGIGALSITVTAKACTITSGATNTVVMPQLVTYSLKVVGDVSAAKSAPFSLGLKCDAGVSVYATLTDATNPANTGNILSLAKNSTATGLGIQIMKQGTNSPLNFGPDSAAKGNTNQWLVAKSAASGGVISVPFEARYIKTAETIKPGAMSALSTITFSYQ
ncbi:fimbrial protein [Cupriavidus sp. SK-3]|uniref:fimbrial protein n=1 Tax=Cupriavidus sp. SK-3 TaxID=1470558 RepID=UPI00136261DD|nr:fimbrial protein [Cupriavidus sp. SK-3]